MSTAAPPPRFSFARSVAFSSLLFILCFGLLEGGLRIVGVAPPVEPRLILRLMDTDITLPFIRADPDVFWSPQPGFRGEFMGKPVSINRLGLRGAEPALPKPADRRRLVCFGDSITFGYGVGDDESYPYQLGRRLAERNADVVNAGVTGFTSHQVLGLLRRLAPTVRADVASICIGWNDDNRRPVDDREYERRLRKIALLEGPLDHLYLYRALKGAYLRTAAVKGLDPQQGAKLTARRADLGQYRENLEAIIRECRARGIQPVFIALPRRRKAGEAPVAAPYADALVQTAGRLDVPVLESGPLGLHTPRESNETFFLDSLHLNPAGNELLAGLLADQLVARGLF